jgi:hypothetical protein
VGLILEKIRDVFYLSMYWAGDQSGIPDYKEAAVWVLTYMESHHTMNRVSFCQSISGDGDLYGISFATTRQLCPNMIERRDM